MGQVLHGSARTTKAIRRAIQHSQESLRTLAKRHGVNPKTIAKWKKRTSAADLPTGPKQARSTVLSAEEEAIIVAFCRHTLLPLDDCLYALPVCSPGHDPTPDPIKPAPLLAASRHLSAARDGGQQAGPRRGSRRTRSATSISTSPRSERSRAASTCWLPSTARPSSPLWSGMSEFSSVWLVTSSSA